MVDNVVLHVDEVDHDRSSHPIRTGILELVSAHSSRNLNDEIG